MIKTVSLDDNVVKALEFQRKKSGLSFSGIVGVALNEWLDRQVVEIEDRRVGCAVCLLSEEGKEHECLYEGKEDTIYSDPAGNMFTLKCVCEGPHAAVEPARSDARDVEAHPPAVERTKVRLPYAKEASPRPIICTEVELEWPENEGDPYKLVRAGGA